MFDLAGVRCNSAAQNGGRSGKSLRNACFFDISEEPQENHGSNCDYAVFMSIYSKLPGQTFFLLISDKDYIGPHASMNALE